MRVWLIGAVLVAAFVVGVAWFAGTRSTFVRDTRPVIEALRKYQTLLSGDASSDAVAAARAEAEQAHRQWREGPGRKLPAGAEDMAALLQRSEFNLWLAATNRPTPSHVEGKEYLKALRVADDSLSHAENILTALR